MMIQIYTNILAEKKRSKIHVDASSTSPEEQPETFSGRHLGQNTV